MKVQDRELESLWTRHSAEWRDTAQVCSQWQEASDFDERLLTTRASPKWWDLLAALGITLLVTREYEHLAMAASARGGKPRLSFFPVPHPSGLVVDRESRTVYLASTRNPNQVYALRPAAAAIPRADIATKTPEGAPLAPVYSTYYPGCLYMHDLALIGSRLYANSVGQNAVVELKRDGGFERVWWPKCIERCGRADFSRNYIQLNSVAAGTSLSKSFFSASSASMGRLRPGHLNYPVDGRGVILSGRTREPVCTGLTRPHSARLENHRIWVANSGYGEVGFVSAGRFEPIRRLPGWTRGLAIVGNVAFVATSRIIPRYARYAPGLDPLKTRCAVHAISRETGEVLGSMEWPNGNQVFAIDWLPDRDSTGFVFDTRSRNRTRETAFFYSYLTRGA